MINIRYSHLPCRRGCIISKPIYDLKIHLLLYPSILNMLPIGNLLCINGSLINSSNNTLCWNMSHPHNGTIFIEKTLNSIETEETSWPILKIMMSTF